jgi:hypothetical protein
MTSDATRTCSALSGGGDAAACGVGSGAPGAITGGEGARGAEAGAGERRAVVRLVISATFAFAQSAKPDS